MRDIFHIEKEQIPRYLKTGDVDEKCSLHSFSDVCMYAYAPVCERHFKDNEVLYRTTFYNESTGETLSTPLKKPRLKENAVPNIFPGCPTYLSSSTFTIRQSPSKKRRRLGQDQIERFIIESLNSKQNYDSKIAFTNFN
ncbi:hypothetical protein HNY73_010157 [Argiope bruennichi]|uniref:THAP-type domain-containing protein n=1 Tax=Argiope bruennichi TaxID=94029 RepID=A0A8T0F028_ARGBR|nr:hypothetical protein HNY73_010157 [Argiope bruennichi]